MKAKYYVHFAYCYLRRTGWNGTQNRGFRSQTTWLPHFMLPCISYLTSVSMLSIREDSNKFTSWEVLRSKWVFKTQILESYLGTSRVKKESVYYYSCLFLTNVQCLLDSNRKHFIHIFKIYACYACTNEGLNLLELSQYHPCFHHITDIQGLTLPPKNLAKY